MKRTITIFLFFFLSFTMAFPRYVGDLDNDGSLSITDVMLMVNIVVGTNTDYELQVADFDGDGDVTVTDVIKLINIIIGINTPEELDEVDALYINYAGGSATYRMPSAWKDYVTVSVDNGHVNIVNTNEEEEYKTVLYGTCDSGSFTYTGAFKTTIMLNGLTLTNPNGGCIDIEDGKRVALVVVDGTENTLIDGTGDQKAALFCKGHLEVSGGGTLNVTGHTKHAVRSKEYMELKKTVGNIHILGAVGDGIHVGQYFEMKGGHITINDVEDDGIQVEALLEGDENDGQLLVKDGIIDIALTSDDVSGLKSDSLMAISGGCITITSSGSDVKGLKSNADIMVSDGTLSITQSGSYLITELSNENGNAYDPSFTTAIRSTGDIMVSGGNITINNTAKGGRGMNTDGDVYITGGITNISANGSGGILDVTNTGTTTQNSYRIYVTIPTTGGGGGPGGGGRRSAWTNVYLYDSSNNMVAQLTNQASFTVNGQTKTFYYYDFGFETIGTYYFKSDNYTSGGGWGGQSTYEIKSATFNLSLTGNDAFYSISNNYQTNGSIRIYSISNVTSTYADAATATEEGDTYKAFGIKASGNFTLEDGDITLTHNGIISRGIKTDGTIYMNGGKFMDTVGGEYMIVGAEPSYSSAMKCTSFVGTGGQVTVVATGAAARGISADNTLTITGGIYDISLSGDGATYTGNGSTEGVGCRGLKSDGNMTLAGGTISIESSANGGKGIKVGNSSVSGQNGAKLVIGNEDTATGPTLTVSTTGSYLSKSSGGWMAEGFIGSCKAVKCMGAVIIYGGDIHLSTTKDSGEGLESKYTITINGGTMECSTYDDAINAASTITFNGGNIWAHASGNDGIDSNDRTTGIVINDGVVIANGKSSPEEGFDCDNAALIINGGVVIGVGGSQGGGSGGLPTSATQAYVSLSNVNLNANTYLSLKDNSGSVVFSYKLPQTINQATICVSSPRLSKNTKASIVYGSTSISNPASSLWDGVYTTGASLTGGTTSSVTPR